MPRSIRSCWILFGFVPVEEELMDCRLIGWLNVHQRPSTGGTAYKTLWLILGLGGSSSVAVAVHYLTLIYAHARQSSSTESGPDTKRDRQSSIQHIVNNYFSVFRSRRRVGGLSHTVLYDIYWMVAERDTQVDAAAILKWRLNYRSSLSGLVSKVKTVLFKSIFNDHKFRP